jgi:ribonucleoside-diphosphate reductase alpha chain
MYSYQQALSDSIAYFEGEELPATAFVDKYALRDGDNNLLESNPDQMHRRLAREFARVERGKFKKPLTEDFIYGLLKDFSCIIPQGSPMTGIGASQYVSLSNCFAAGTRVFTMAGVKNIEDVILGDEVVTQAGTVKPVVQLHKNPLNGRQLFHLKCFRTPGFVVTGNHRLWSISQEQMRWGEKPQWNEVGYLRVGDYVAIPRRADVGAEQSFSLSEVPVPEGTVVESAEEGKIGLRTPHRLGVRRHRLVNDSWEVTNDFAYFLGLWYGDGCVFSSDTKGRGLRDRKAKTHKRPRGITFTLNAKEKGLIEFVSRFGERLFGIPADLNNNKHIDGSFQIAFHSTIVGAAFEYFFGRRCDGKKLHPSVFKWSRELVMRLVDGLIASDGTVTKEGDVRVVLRNDSLVESFYHLLRSHGVAVGLSRGVGKQQYSRLDFPRGCSFIQTSGKRYNDNRIERLSSAGENPYHVVTFDGLTFVRVDDKQKADAASEFVYTLGIKDDHSYAIEGILAQNCFVCDPPSDSYGGIMHTDEQIVQICKRRGGVGTDLSNLRPEFTPTSNSARSSTGVVAFMERYSRSIREVGQNGRRGALMLTISVHHPQVLDFARVKLDDKRVTGANISIRLSDEFLRAVEDDTEYEQRWPVDSPTPSISRKVRARDVWKEIIHCAWVRAEPGLLFWDRILEESPADCYGQFGFRTVATNPCAELPLSVLDSCRLLVLNLFHFVRDPFTAHASFDWQAFHDHARLAQRLMDDLIDLELEAVQRILRKIENDPETEFIKRTEYGMWKRIKQACKNGRRTGTGVTAIGDTLAALGVRYGSDESIELVDKFYRTLKLGCYHESVEMSKELGPFPVWNPELEKDCPFLLRIRDEDPALYEDMQKFGRRNIALLTTAPTGTTSLVAGPRPFFQTTGGIEPLFQTHFVRRKKINHGEKNARVDFVDDLGDRWQEFTVYHPKLRLWMQATGETDPTKSPYHGCCAEDIDWQQRVKLQAAAQRHVDHGISSTLNLPEDVSEEKVAEIYETAWRAGCKGVTVYRKNCRTGVLVDAKESGPKVSKTDAPKRPRELPCELHFTRVKGKEYFVVVGLLGGEPYEVIAGENAAEDGRFIEATAGKATSTKVKRGQYRLERGETVLAENLTDNISDEEEAITRMVSTALRHGADVAFVVHQLEKSKGDLASFGKALARVLKKYIKDGTKVSGETCPSCGSENVIRQEGCVSCKDCSYSKC